MAISKRDNDDRKFARCSKRDNHEKETGMKGKNAAINLYLSRSLSDGDVVIIHNLKI